MTLKRKLLALVSSLLFATSVFAAPSISGPHVTMQTDGSLSTGQANIITNNAGPIQFFTNKTLCGYFDGSTCALTGVSLGTVTLASPTISGDATFSSAAASIIGGATSISIGSAGSTIIKGRNDANRLFTFDAATDTALTFKFGDGTAAQSLSILGSTADTADTQTFQYGVATTISSTRGAYGQLFGNEYGGGVSGAYYLSTGDAAGADMFLMAKDDIRFQTEAGNEVGSWDTTTGNLSFNGTFGGNFIMSKAATGIILGTASAIDADYTPNSGLLAVGTGNAFSINQIGSGANASGTRINAWKTRSTGTDANTIVQSGDEIFSWNFYGADGAAYVPAANITGVVDGTPGSSDMPGRLEFYTTPDGSSSLALVLSLRNTKAAQFTGTITSTASADIGWNPVAAANQACNTTCATSGCVAGFNLTAGNITGSLLACTDATADVCLCAGAS